MFLSSVSSEPLTLRECVSSEARPLGARGLATYGVLPTPASGASVWPSGAVGLVRRIPTKRKSKTVWLPSALSADLAGSFLVGLVDV